MKPFWISLGLIAVLFQLLPFGESPPEKPKVEPPVKGWWMVSYFAVPPTGYSSPRKGIIKAESLGSRSSLFKQVGEKEMMSSILSWKWQISNVVRSAIEMKKDRFDAAARIMVIFGSERSLIPLEGTEPSGFKIEYIWASRLPKGKVFDHPGEKHCKVYVLESGDGKSGQWVEESRNIRRDFESFFGKEPLSLLSIGIQTDTDQSNERVIAYYTDPVLKRK